MARSIWFLPLALALTSCAAFFPELSTRFSEAPKAASYDPPPPPDRHFVRVVSGVVPPKARDGRDWGQAFGSMPDPFVKVFVNDKELFRTDPASDTFEPKWEKSTAANFRIALGDKVEVQLWHKGALTDTPVGVREQTLTPDMLDSEEVLFDLGNGAQVTLAILPAKPVWGLGFWFELRNDSAYVTRLVDSSPASRADVAAGDRILKIDDKPVEKMTVDEMKSLLSAFPAAGRTLALQHKEGATLQVTLKEGPIYPLFGDYQKLPVTPK